jgi:CelD/BcsL family acetyltransferase involved in cellulose biosynthesis
VLVATDEAGLEGVAQVWDRLAPASPHASRRLFTLVGNTSGDILRPHVVLIDEPGAEPVLVVARVERRPLVVKAGYRTLFAAPARWLVVVAGGIVGATSQADYDRAVRALLDALRRGDADILQLDKVELGNPIELALRAEAPAYRRSQSGAPSKHHRSDLSAGFEAFCAARSKNTRWRIRKRLRRLADPEAKMVVSRVGAADDPIAACQIIDAIAARSYQRGIGVGFADDERHRELMAWAVAGGPFHAWTLSIDGTPVAFLTGLLHERTFYLFDTAFDPATEAEEPGSILLAHVLQELAESGDVDGFDYGYGDAQYKQTMSDASHDEVDLRCYAPRPAPLALNALATSVAASVRLAKRVVGPERVAALRRRRRKELAAVEPAAAETP